MRPLLVALLLSCSIACESLRVVTTDENEANWGEYRTLAEGRSIVYKLPPNPQIWRYPKNAAVLAATSREAQVIAIMDYGYGLPEPRMAELSVWMEVSTVDGDGIDPSWSSEQFARFYWSRMLSNRQMISPSYPKFEKLIRSELPTLGDTTWYQLTYLDELHAYAISGDVYIRPISSTHVLIVSGLYYDYASMSAEAIERRRALMRKIVAQVRVEPPFGAVHPP